MLSIRNLGAALAGVISLLGTNSAVAAPAYDVVGVSLGASPDEALKIVNTRGSPWQIFRYSYPSGRLSRFVGLRRNKMQNTVEIITANFTEYSQKAWFVAREIHFDAGERPLISSLFIALDEKYGTPQGKFPNVQYSAPIGTEVWSKKDDGSPELGASNYKSSCVDDSSEDYLGFEVINSPHGIHTPLHLHAGCGISVRADAEFFDARTANSLTVRIADQAMALQDLRLQQQAASDHQNAATKREIEGAQRVKPAL